MNVRSRSIQRSLLIVFVSLGVTCFTSSPASAGTYNIQQCHTASGFAVAGGWNWGGNAYSGALAGCTNAFRMNAAAGNGFQGLWWSTPTLPAGLKFTNTNFHYMGGSGGQTSAYARFCAGPGTGLLGICDTYYTSGLLGTDDKYLNVGCNITGPWNDCNRMMFDFTHNSGTLQTMSAPGAHYWFNDLTFTINDPTNPTANAPTGGTMNRSQIAQPRGWNRGTVTVNVSGQDSQGGIKSVNGYADGNTILQPTSTSSSCGYTYWQPCPVASNLQAAASINTEVLTADSGDGPHTYTSRAVDAGDNVSTSSVTFHVDNTAPSTPESVLLENATAGWNDDNSFDASWTNGAEVDETETQSGIAAVKVDVNPTDPGTQTDPAPVTVPVGQSVSGISATIDSVSGVSVPDVGEWTLRLAVVDRAGNESPVGDGTEGAADSDHTIGYDPNPPAAPAGRANGWISRSDLATGYDQQWSYNPPPTQFAPICGFASKISQTQIDDPGTTINIPGDVRAWQLPADLEEANHFVHLRAVTCAGLASPTTEHVEAKVDLTDPTPNYSGVEEARWYRDGKQVTINGTDELSGMAPSTTANYLEGAYLDYTINGNAPIDTPRGSSATVIVTGEGQKELSFSPVDVAGNKARATVVRFGIDATNPDGHFEPRDTERPTLLRAALADPTSGLDTAMIEVRRKGSGDAWKLLPTGLADFSGNNVGGFPKAALAQARFPDTSLPIGTYEARVRTYDQAGNELTTSKDRNGNDLSFENPMRDGVGLSASLFKSTRKCNSRSRRSTRKGRNKHRVVRCNKKQRGKVVFVGAKPTLAVGYKRGAVVQGFLVGNRYGALSRQPIEIYTKEKNKPETLAGTTSTRSDGSYVFKLRPGVSRTVRVYYPGTELRQDASAIVNLGTGAKLKLSVSKKRAKTGQTVTFRGNVTAFDKTFPASGKIIALQFYAGKKWRPAVAIARTDANGRFSVKYKFDRMPKSVKARIVFRVIAPAEDGWGHATSASRRIVMRVN